MYDDNGKENVFFKVLLPERVHCVDVNDPDDTKCMQPHVLQRKIFDTKDLVSYQINPTRRIVSPNGNYTYVRILFEDIWKMQEYHAAKTRCKRH